VSGPAPVDISPSSQAPAQTNSSNQAPAHISPSSRAPAQTSPSNQGSQTPWYQDVKTWVAAASGAC
ncbi:unnamed protein product, partial [Ectocarpus fasciculatus]